jgi:predicted lipoprotein with Yx(FWY)xxD motif
MHSRAAVPTPRDCLLMVAAVALLAAAPVPNAAAEVQVKVAHQASVGDHLTDAHGRTLYLFEKDERGRSTCYDACARAWPPLVTEGSLVAGRGVDKDKLSTVKRKDGSLQVTYGGWPLYYFVKDDEPGNTYGQEMEHFGAVWYMVSPQGTKAEAEASEEQEGAKKGDYY